MLLKVEKTMREGYTFKGLTVHLGIGAERARELIQELALELRAREGVV